VAAIDDTVCACPAEGSSAANTNAAPVINTLRINILVRGS
jgi:hypothetical protein